MANLASKKCVPCEGGTSPLEHDKVQEYLKQVEGWELVKGSPSTPFRINKMFKFKTFMEGIRFVNEVARVAEQENHHPDIHIHYRKVTLELTTHAIKGLSENDFIMAAKIDQFYKWEEKVEKAVVKKLFTVKFLLVVVLALLAFFLWQKYF